MCWNSCPVSKLSVSRFAFFYYYYHKPNVFLCPNKPKRRGRTKKHTPEILAEDQTVNLSFRHNLKQWREVRSSAVSGFFFFVCLCVCCPLR